MIAISPRHVALPRPAFAVTASFPRSDSPCRLAIAKLESVAPMRAKVCPTTTNCVALASAGRPAH